MSDRFTVVVRLPFAGAALLDFLIRHDVDGIETGVVQGRAADAVATWTRTLRLPHGPAVVALPWNGGVMTADVRTDPRDQAEARTRISHLLDADADPGPLDAHLGLDPHLGPLVAATPGLRVPGVLDPAEMLFRTLIGQQISLAAARTCAATITRRHGERLETGDPALAWLFPTPSALAAVDPQTLPMPKARGRALVGVAGRIADGRLNLDPACDADDVRADLLACPGIGPWTADYVLMRAWHAPDVLLASDLIIRRELVARAVEDTAGWSPFRSHATLHLWHDFLQRVPATGG